MVFWCAEITLVSTRIYPPPGFPSQFSAPMYGWEIHIQWKVLTFLSLASIVVKSCKGFLIFQIDSLKFFMPKKCITLIVLIFITAHWAIFTKIRLMVKKKKNLTSEYFFPKYFMAKNVKSVRLWQKIIYPPHQWNNNPY